VHAGGECKAEGGPECLDDHRTDLRLDMKKGGGVGPQSAHPLEGGERKGWERKFKVRRGKGNEKDLANISSPCCFIDNPRRPDWGGGGNQSLG